MQVIYAARRNADQTEGRGPMIPIAHFTQKDDAEDAAQGQGVMGYGNGDVEEILVFACIAEWKQGEKDKVRQAALSKLTDAEKRALGLT